MRKLKIKNQKFLLVVISALFFLLIANQVQAQAYDCGQPIVPCELTGPNRCTLCHFFEMLNRIINYILFCLIPYLAIFMLVLGGLMYVGAVLEVLPGGWTTLSQAKRLFTSVAIGLLIAYSAWILIHFFLLSLGYTENWWEIQCATGPVVLSPAIGNLAVTQPSANIADLVSTSLNINVSSDGILFEYHTEPIYSLAVSGSLTLNSPLAFVRIILVDNQGREYLVLEASGPFDSGTIPFQDACRETCALDGVIPKILKAETDNASLSLTEKLELKNKNKLYPQVLTMGIENYQNQVLKQIEWRVIEKINNYNKAEGLRWTAGETGVSSYSYKEKKGLFGVRGKLPNFAGFEYYKGGIFETEAPKATTQTKSPTASSLPRSWDWRNRHGKNWLTSIKNQGWCGSCWAFAQVGAVEAVTNLYFNQQLNLNLSEQQFLSCTKERGCCGAITEEVKDFYEREGVTTEDCFSYQDGNFFETVNVDEYCDGGLPLQETPCGQKCPNWQSFLVSSQAPGEHYRGYEFEKMKEMLIKYGPLYGGTWACFGVYDFSGHAMVMTGYDTTPRGETIFIFKNSWDSNWGEQGYAKINPYSPWCLVDEVAAIGMPIEIAHRPDLKIKCEDFDEDGYCNWGISEQKPNTCPDFCKPEKDCDDSNPNLGPFDLNYDCISITPSPSDITPPRIGKPRLPRTVNAFRPLRVEVDVSDDTEVSNCQLVVDGWNRGPMFFSTFPCQSCVASRNYEFFMTLPTPGDYVIQQVDVQCWDRAGNSVRGEAAEVKVYPPPQDIFVHEIYPRKAQVNQSTTLSANLFHLQEIVLCELYIDDKSIGDMVLSKRPCTLCTASKTHTFSKLGTYSAYAQCWDKDGNSGKGLAVEIRVEKEVAELSVGQIQPTTALKDKPQAFYTDVSDDEEVVACILEINGSPVDYMNLNKSPCQSCEAWLDYTFTRTGNYSLVARCYDNKGNVAEGAPVRVVVVKESPFCPPLAYPNGEWQRVWYEYDPDTKKPADCLFEGASEPGLQFDYNWSDGKVIWDKKDNVYLTASRTINLTTAGNYTFTVGSDDGVRVWIDDTLYLDKWTDRVYTIDTFTVNLSAGDHKFRIDYYEKRGSARLSFSYQEPSPIPTCNCTSWSGWQNIGCGQCNCPSDKMCQKKTRACNPENCDITEKAQCISHQDCQVPSPTPTPTPTPTPSPACNWTPCNPNPNWQCGETKVGSSPYCEGRAISWGWGDDGEVYCPEGQVATTGFCGKKNDDFVKKSEERVKTLPHPQVFSQSTTFKPRSVWYCQFGCKGLFCGPDGCGWACCAQAEIGVNRLELKIFDSTGRLLYEETVVNQATISWDGKDDQGKLLRNGAYIYQTRIDLTDGRAFTTQDKVFIQR